MSDLQCFVVFYENGEQIYQEELPIVPTIRTGDTVRIHRFVRKGFETLWRIDELSLQDHLFTVISARHELETQYTTRSDRRYWLVVNVEKVPQ